MTSSPRLGFWLRRLHSLSGVLALGGFLAEHLWTNANALAGAVRFQRAVAAIHALPALWLLELTLIGAPLAFHAGYGLWLTRAASSNVQTYPTARNWAYLTQRISGVLVLLFVLWHLWEYRVQVAFFGMAPASFYDTLAAHLSSTHFGIPWLAFGYLLGLGASVVHLANGMVTASITWGVCGSRRAQRLVGWAAATLGLGLFTLGTLTVVHFATGPLGWFGASLAP